MNVHVLLQTDGVAEGFSADVAAKRSRSTVRPPDVNLQSMGRREHLITGDTVVGAGGGGVVRAAVQRLLRLWTAADVGAVQIAGVVQHCGAETHWTDLVGGRHRLPGVRRLVVRRVFCHVRLI